MTDTEVIPPLPTPTSAEVAGEVLSKGSAEAVDVSHAAKLKQIALEGGGVEQFSLPPLVPQTGPNPNASWFSKFLKFIERNLPGVDGLGSSVDWGLVARGFLILAIVTLIFVIIRAVIRARAQHNLKGQRIETRRVPELWMERELQIALAEQDYARALRVRWALHLHRARVSPDLTPSERAQLTKLASLQARVPELDRGMFDSAHRPNLEEARELMRFLDRIEGAGTNP